MGRLENRALTFGDNQQTHPRWSPDGKWIAFLSGRGDENENDQLWILSSAGGEAEQLTKEKGSIDDFAWAPDSRRIALVVHDPDPRNPEAKEKEKKTVPPTRDRPVSVQAGYRWLPDKSLVTPQAA